MNLFFFYLEKNTKKCKIQFNIKTLYTSECDK